MLCPEMSEVRETFSSRPPTARNEEYDFPFLFLVFVTRYSVSFCFHADDSILYDPIILVVSLEESGMLHTHVTPHTNVWQNIHTSHIKQANCFAYVYPGKRCVQWVRRMIEHMLCGSCFVRMITSCSHSTDDAIWLRELDLPSLWIHLSHPA